MSKTKKVVLITSAIALACIIGACIVVGVFFSCGSDLASFSNIFGSSLTEINESEVLDLDGISTLAIDCDSADIEFVDSSDTKVTIAGKILKVGDMEDVLNVYEDNGVLHIDSKFVPAFFNFTTGFDITVYLPADPMVDLVIDCTSGDILIDGMQFGNVDIDKKSGRARISSCTADSVMCESMSGDTDMSQCDFESLYIKSASGQIDIADMQGAITIDSTSGDIDISGAQDAIDIGSTSGNIDIDYTGVDVAPIAVKVTSGRIRLYLDADAAFDLRAQVTSGNIDTDLPIMVTGALGDDIVGDSVDGSCNGGGNLISVTSSSGGIGIYQK